MTQTEELLETLQTISKKLRLIKEEQIRNINLQDFSLSNMKYIETIYELNNPTFIELTTALKLSKPTVTIMVNKLIEKGFVNKTKSENDRRTFYLSLSKTGKEIIDSHKKMHQTFAENISKLYSKKELGTLISLLQRI